MLKAETFWKVGLFVPYNQLTNAKEKFLQGFIMLLQWMRMIRKQNSLITDMDTVLVIWREDQTIHSISLSQSLT